MTEAQQFIKLLKDKCTPISLANGIVVYKFKHNNVRVFCIKNNWVIMDTYQVKVRMENNGVTYNEICDVMEKEFHINNVSNQPLYSLLL
jgi:hypothetical protein